MISTRLRAAALAAALAVLPLPALSEETPVPTLSLSAEGSVQVAPDTAIVTVGVMTQARTAGPALTENNARMRALMDQLKGAGIEERDISTSGFTIEPQVVYPQPAADGTQEPPRVTGYRVDNRVTVKIRDVAAAGEVLDRVVRIGANQVQGIAFVLEDDAAALNEARTLAMRDAEAKAKVYAEAGGFQLGRLMRVSEQTSPVPVFKTARMQAGMAAAEAVPVSPGEQDLTVTVQVDWEIRQPN